MTSSNVRLIGRSGQLSSFWILLLPFVALPYLLLQRHGRYLSSSPYALTEHGILPFSPSRQELYTYVPPRKRTTIEKVNDSLYCGEGPGYDKYFELGNRERAAEDEDRIIYKVFFEPLLYPTKKQSEDDDDSIMSHAVALAAAAYNNTAFIYVEVGAYDGVSESTTRFFDLCLGWQGLLIEANPMIFPHMRANRQTAHRMNMAATCSQADEVSNRKVGFSKVKWTNAALTDESPIRNAYLGKADVRVEVPCGSLTTPLVDLFGLKEGPNRGTAHVHFLSVDVSGAEELVLRFLDFEKVFVDIVLVDQTNRYCKKCESRRKTKAMMAEAGYGLYQSIVPTLDVYVHSRSPFAEMAALEEKKAIQSSKSDATTENP